MKIDVREAVGEVSLGQLKPGETFRHRAHLWVKTDDINCYDNPRCARLKDGQLEGLPVSLKVVPVALKVVLDDGE